MLGCIHFMGHLRLKVFQHSASCVYSEVSTAESNGSYSQASVLGLQRTAACVSQMASAERPRKSSDYVTSVKVCHFRKQRPGQCEVNSASFPGELIKGEKWMVVFLYNYTSCDAAQAGLPCVSCFAIVLRILRKLPVMSCASSVASRKESNVDSPNNLVRLCAG